MDIKKNIEFYNLPKFDFVVVGSGILGALAIRESNDIDMIVNQEVYDEFAKQGWEHSVWGEDQVVLKNGPFDVGTNWMGESLDSLLSRATVIDDVAYYPLEELLAWKRERTRQKDINDVLLIERYLARQNKSLT